MAGSRTATSSGEPAAAGAPGSETKRYRANVDELVHEDVEGEVIIIHLSSGDYFSLTGSGARIWELLGYGADSESLVAQLALEYGEIPADTHTVLDDLLERLVADSLVVEVTDGETLPDPVPGPAHAADHVSAAPDSGYVPPKLEKFTDLSDYFLVDPIHDVGTSGWPHRQSPG